MRFKIDQPARARNGRVVFSWSTTLTIGYTLVCVAGGGYVAARVARQTEVRHALVLGAIEVVFTIGAMLQLRRSDRLWIWTSNAMS